jgi:hypothetical protein
VPRSMEREIRVLKDLVRATCQSADTCAASAQAGGAADPYWAMLLEQLREDRRLLLVDLVRCLLLRGLPVPEVRAAMTEVLAPADPEGDPDLLRADLEIAERKLELALRRVLADALVSQATLELLSVHYLRLRLRLGELEAAAGRRGGGGAAAAVVPAAAIHAAPARAGARLLH